MIKILFVCHGNICRSPMAEAIFLSLLSDAGIKKQYAIDSAATSTEEVGNPIYPPAMRELEKHGIAACKKRARQVVADEYQHFDWFVCMDHRNETALKRLFQGDPDQKVHLLMAFTDSNREEVADPWYTGDFQATWDDLWLGCKGLLSYLEKGEL